MSLRSRHACPTDDEVLRLLANDLPARRAAKLRTHVDGCARCTDRLHEWQSTMSLYSVPPGAHDPVEQQQPQWRGFDRALATEHASWSRDRAVARRRWSSAAAIVICLIVGGLWSLQTEVTLDAEEALSRAVAQEDRARETDATIRIRQVAHVEHAAETWTSRSGASRSEASREVARRLSAYGFQWSVPLSARPYQQWRRQTPNRTERLERLTADLIQVSTTTTAGPIREAHIAMRQATFEPVTLRWRFSDGLEVEWTSLAASWPADAAPVDTAPHRATATAPTVDGESVARHATRVAPVVPDIDGIELDTRIALQRLGIPVGRYISVRQREGEIRIHGSVETPALATRVTEYARTHDRVEGDVEVRSEPTWDARSSAGFESWLASTSTKSDPRFRETFAARLSELDERLHDAVYAFADLAAQYPADRAGKLSPESQQKIRQLAERLYADVSTTYDDLERHLAPLVDSSSRPAGHAPLPEDWRLTASAAMEALQQLSGRLGVVFGRSTETQTADKFVLHAREQLGPGLNAFAVSLGRAR